MFLALPLLLVFFFPSTRNIHSKQVKKKMPSNDTTMLVVSVRLHKPTPSPKSCHNFRTQHNFSYKTLETKRMQDYFSPRGTVYCVNCSHSWRSCNQFMYCILWCTLFADRQHGQRKKKINFLRKCVIALGPPTKIVKVQKPCFR